MADFYISPEQHMQLLKVLDAFGTEDIHRLPALKYRLSPIVAKSREEQEQFYALWDNYLEEIVPPPPPEEPLHWWQKLKVWQIALILAGITGLLAFYFTQSQQAQQPEMLIRFEHPPQAQMRDNIRFLNVSVNIDSANTRFDWEWQDIETNQTEHTQENSFHWSHTITTPGASSRKRIILKAFNRNGTEIGRDTSRLELLCANPPAINAILAPQYAQIDEAIRFRIDESATESARLLYSWDFGDGQTDSIPIPTHTFEEAGAYTVQLTVRRPGARSKCEVIKRHRITIGQEKAYLTEEVLAWDEGRIRLAFGWGTWLLLGLLGLVMLYNWYRWLRQKPAPPKEAKVVQKAIHQKPSDKGPYYIPFISNNELIQADSGLFRLADVLRQRQEGLRKLVDIQATVQQTIEQGGFPSFQYKSTTHPSEYLFLIDEQARGSHQASLFAFLAEFLQNKDVYITLFWYNTDLQRFWNEEFSKGLGLSDLHRLYPRHRLMVMGDGHSLIDPSAEGKPSLKAPIAKAFRAWNNRLLLTPKSIASWTYREALLYQLFTLFPSNMTGFQGAMAFLETDHEEEDEKYRIPYDKWVDTHNDPPVYPNTNYVKWRDFKSYKTYFGEYPEVFRWLCALAVYPTPTWEVSLAIGRAIGAKVTLENLLLLAQVPWLQGQTFSPRLRQKLLDELDEQTIQQARKAVKNTLENGVNPIVAGSHADLDYRRDLAIQNILIDPNNTDYIQEIEIFKEKGWLSKKQYMDINAGLAKNSATTFSNLDQLLEADTGEGPPEPTPKLQLNRNFYWGTGMAVLLLILGALIWLVDQKLQDYELEVESKALTIFQKKSSKAKDSELNDLIFIKEIWHVDSSTIYNQMGYELWYEEVPDETTEQRLARKDKAGGYFSKATTFGSSINPIAVQNVKLSQLNLSIEHYNQFLETFDRNQWLSRAKRMMDAIDNGSNVNDNLSLKIAHARGLMAFYDNKQAEAISATNLLFAATDSLFFDTLSTYPHLHSLLNPALYELERVTSLVDPRCYMVHDSIVQLPLFSRPQLDLVDHIKEPANQDESNRLKSQSAPAKKQGYTYLPTGTKLQKMGESIDFFQVRAGDRIGYILKDMDGPTLQLCEPGSDLAISGEWQKPAIADFGPPVEEPKFMWFLDNFHGALTPGKRSPVLPDGRQFFEYEFTRDIVRRMAERLDQLGVQYHVVVPEVEVDNMLEERVRRVNDFQTNLIKAYIAINCNAGPGPWTNDAVSGIEVWFLHNDEAGREMATTFQQQLLAATGWKDRKIRSTPRRQFLVLRRTKAISILTENGFYNNRQQVVELLTDSTRQKIADAHVRAILEVERKRDTNRTTEQLYEEIIQGMEALARGKQIAKELIDRLNIENPYFIENFLRFAIKQTREGNFSRYDRLLQVIQQFDNQELQKYRSEILDLLDAGKKAGLETSETRQIADNLRTKLSPAFSENDTDGDEIPNSIDQCPRENGKLPNGCVDQISFTVADITTREPLVGASILLKGSSTGTISDIEGEATLSLPSETPNQTLVFSYNGYQTMELSLQEIVDQAYSINLEALPPDPEELPSLPSQITLYFDENEPDPQSKKQTTEKDYFELAERYYARRETYLRERTNSVKIGAINLPLSQLTQRYNAFFEKEIKERQVEFTAIYGSY
jgi:N-acetylmuramoyl-L-alanine amidase